MLIFFKGQLNISELDYLFNATQSEKITDREPPRVNIGSFIYWLYKFSDTCRK